MIFLYERKTVLTNEEKLADKKNLFGHLIEKGVISRPYNLSNKIIRKQSNNAMQWKMNRK